MFTHAHLGQDVQTTTHQNGKIGAILEMIVSVTYPY